MLGMRRDVRPNAVAAAHANHDFVKLAVVDKVFCFLHLCDALYLLGQQRGKFAVDSLNCSILKTSPFVKDFLCVLSCIVDQPASQHHVLLPVGKRNVHFVGQALCHVLDHNHVAVFDLLRRTLDHQLVKLVNRCRNPLRCQTSSAKCRS